jgi:hypothetical protein
MYKMCCCFHCIFSKKIISFQATSYYNTALKGGWGVKPFTASYGKCQNLLKKSFLYELMTFSALIFN